MAKNLAEMKSLVTTLLIRVLEWLKEEKTAENREILNTSSKAASDWKQLLDSIHPNHSR